jgi:hypothetical protein
MPKVLLTQRLAQAAKALADADPNRVHETRRQMFLDMRSDFDYLSTRTTGRYLTDTEVAYLPQLRSRLMDFVLRQDLKVEVAEFEEAFGNAYEKD